MGVSGEEKDRTKWRPGGAPGTLRIHEQAVKCATVGIAIDMTESLAAGARKDTLLLRK